jgi:serine protease AprX
VRFWTFMTNHTTAFDGSFGVPQLGRSVSLLQAARVLDVSRRTIYNRIKSGELQTVRTRGGSQRVLVESLRRASMNAAVVEAPVPAPRPDLGSDVVRPKSPQTQVTVSAVSLIRTHHVMARLRWIAALLLTASAAFAPSEARAQEHARLSDDLRTAIRGGDQAPVDVILTATQETVDAVAARHGLVVKKRLATGALLTVPAGALENLANDDAVDQLSGNTPIQAQMVVTNVAIGADQVQAGGWGPSVRGLTGKGVGVAVIDSGIAKDLPELKGRVVANVDFTGTSRSAKDFYGHGTHVAGIIAAATTTVANDNGVAPGAHLINLKVLDAQGKGTAADMIEAMDWVVANKALYNIKVVNLSLGGAVRQSWRDDPLSHAVERAYRAGIVVVAAAGNFGKMPDGRQVYGGITSPGNSPYALTIGATNANGTAYRSDDVVASYSSKGPTMFDHLVKPDLVAPGSKIAGLIAPGSALALDHPERIVVENGLRRLMLSGTSMAAAVASGAAAQIIGAYPQIQPVGVRFRMQYSASRNSANYVIAEGAGSLNLLGSITLAMPGIRQVVIATENTAGSQLIFGHSSVWQDIDMTSGVDALLWGHDGFIWAEADGIIWAETDGIIWAEDDGIIWAEAKGIIWAETGGILQAESDGIIWAEGKGIIWAEDDGIIWAENQGDTLFAGSDDGIIWAEDDGIIWAENDGIIWAEDDGIIWAEDDGIIWAEDDGIIWAE